MTPAPMHSMLRDKETKAEALKKRDERSKMVTKDVPPTTPGTFSTSLPNIKYFFNLCLK